MKLCPKCEQAVAQDVSTCPACGTEIGAGRTHIDDYRILDVLHEGHATLLCRAVHEPTGKKVMVRLFTRRSGVDEEIARRLQRELEPLRELPADQFVQHQVIRRSAEGLWYRVSEWVDAENWGSLLASGKLRDAQTRLELFEQIATALAVLHRQGHIIPHLILNDIMVVQEDDGRLRAKIDYKLSRFFDPKMDRPGPMLAQLLARHPDIVNHRPLDARSDIWSLGKAFVEVLAGDLDIANHEAAVDDLSIPDRWKVLLRVMLADDPDLRPQSMDEVVQALSGLRDEPVEPTPGPPVPVTPPHAKSIRRIQRRIRLLAAGVVVIAMLGVLAWYLGRQREDVEAVLEGYANRYAHSVAFVAVDYRLSAKASLEYRRVAEGTAFLVDEAGYLLTSRHVVCPWLEDPRLLQTAERLLQSGVVPRLEYEIYLWFEGQKAFNPAARLLEQTDVADYFVTKDAYSTEHPARSLSIAAVVMSTRRPGRRLASPLNDDFAVVKIDPVPEGLTPLPVDPDVDPRSIRRLTHVIALGFPLGSRSQVDTVNASAVDGHVRRSFRNLLQIDSSLHGGNSGGPIIDARGKVIGIVAAVAMEQSGGLFATTRPLGDIGLILPITGAAKLLAETKAGQMKWNGVLDFTLDSTVEQIKKTAIDGRWAEARSLAERELENNAQPELLTAAGMLAFCTGDLPVARTRFSHLCSMDPEDGRAKLMLYLIDWLSGDARESPYREELLAADWRSPMEFAGYLVRMLEGDLPIESGVEAAYNLGEQSWLKLVAGLWHADAGDFSPAETRLRQASLAIDTDTWAYLLALASLEQLYRERRDSLAAESQWAAHQVQVEEFRESRDDSIAAAIVRKTRMVLLQAEMASGDLEPSAWLELLERMLELEPENLGITATLAFGNAAIENWSDALRYTRAFLSTKGRFTSTRMSLGLLEAGLLRRQGSNDDATRTLGEYEKVVPDDFYVTLAESLAGRVDAESVAKRAEQTPEDLLVANTILGFWAEGADDTQLALGHYRTALASFLVDWLEYGFARARIKRLKQTDAPAADPADR